MLLEFFFIEIFVKRVLALLSCDQHRQSAHLTPDEGQLFLNSVPAVVEVA